MTKMLFFICLFLLSGYTLHAEHQPVFSTACFFSLPSSGREVLNMNVAWRFLKADAENAWKIDFDDSDWDVVSLPHGLEYLPDEASGCVNYQGVAWYRKHFTPAVSLKGKRIFIHFEAIMGKSKVWVNGKLVKEYFGGFLPVIADITDAVDWTGKNVIAVCADNSDDPMYPPGKSQDMLDFCYFGGIYRDCWLVAHNNVYITDPNYENERAGGGVFVAFDNISDALAEVLLKVQVRNHCDAPFAGKIVCGLYDKDNNEVAVLTHKLRINASGTAVAAGTVTVKKPNLWSPENPYLYWLNVVVKDEKGKIVDGYRKRIGIRSIAFKGREGFWLNGKPYPFPLIGANRHQDFAVVGNALSNSIHWKDAKKIRDAGLRVIRNAHYPQDPAFMDACDELGLFVIANTPGWQFWNKEPVFEQRVYQDIRNMVRRDRNHPSVFLWEPILNETWYPDSFAQNACDIVSEEYPYPGCYAACDREAKGHEYFPVLFCHPSGGDTDRRIERTDSSKCYFTREWGDNVDDWGSHNSPSRVSRAWGEEPMIIQARHYAKPSYAYTSYDALCRTSRQHVGGCLWHSFDHQRGYHPDPFYGGVMDIYRQPKYSYYMLMAQRPAEKSGLTADNGAMVFIAHEMTPFSGKDVCVYSNCEEVRLTVFKGGKQFDYQKPSVVDGMPSPIICFKDVYDFMEDKALSRQGKQDEVYMLAEGLIDGQVVATCKVAPARRPANIILWLDNEGIDLVADGSDFVTVVAGITDNNGNIKRLNEYSIRFFVEGEGRLAGDDNTWANPRRVVWGTAPVLVRSTVTPGKIKVRAEVLMKGSQVPLSGEIEFQSVLPDFPLLYDSGEAGSIGCKTVQGDRNIPISQLQRELEHLQQELNALKLKEVEKQQSDFE